jgi:hypothetical protein
MTSTSVGWALLDGSDPTETPLDHDAFDIGADEANDGDISRHAAAVRGAQAIANTSGYRVKSVGVTWTDDVDGQATLLLKSLAELGFDNVVSVRLPKATQAWTDAFGHDLGFTKCAVCVLESAAVTVMTVGNGTVRSSVTHTRESADGLSRWLTGVFEKNGWQPERLFLIGLRGDLELISGRLEETLSIPVEATVDAQLALGWGAALALSTQDKVGSAHAAPKPSGPGRMHRWSRMRPQARPTTKADAKTDALEARTDVLKKPTRDTPLASAQRPALPVHDAAAPKTEAAEPDVVTTKVDVIETKPDVGESKTEIITLPAHDGPADGSAKKSPSRFGPHARAATMVVAGLVAVFALGPLFVGHKETRSTEDRPVSGSSTTSGSVRVVPSPALPPAAAHPVAAQPVPAPAPRPVAVPPSELSATQTEATRGGDAQATTTPAVEPTVTPQTPVTAEPMVAPAAPQAPTAPQPIAAPPEPAALPPALGPPPGPAPALAAPPTPEAPVFGPPPGPAPAFGPAPGPAAPVSPAPEAPTPTEPVPPGAQDPVAVVPDPMFAGLP